MILSFAIAFALTLCMAAAAHALTARGVAMFPLDLPGKRKNHARPTLLAGVLIVPVLCFFVLFSPAPSAADPLGGWAVAGLAIAAGIGWLDDWHKERFRWWIKLGGQLAAGMCAGGASTLR